jgi:hypothetical protein
LIQIPARADPDHLEVEMTESAAVRSCRAAKRLAAIRRRHRAFVRGAVLFSETMRGLAWCGVLVACATACGGESASKANDDEGGTGGAGGTAGSGAGTTGASAGSTGAAGTGGSGAASCEGPVTPPTLELRPYCADFVPSLSPQALDWAGLDPFEGEFMVHRFSAPASLANGCGYDLIVRLPRITFNGSGSYAVSVWWLSGVGAPRLIAGVFRRDGDPLPELVVADPTAGEFASMLSAPMTIEPSGAACTPCLAGGSSGLVGPALTQDGIPLSCEAEAEGTSLLCNNGSGQAFRVLTYCSASGSVEYPVVYGRAQNMIRTAL